MILLLYTQHPLHAKRMAKIGKCTKPSQYFTQLAKLNDEISEYMDAVDPEDIFLIFPLPIHSEAYLQSHAEIGFLNS